MKTITFGDYMDAKRQMKAKPTLVNKLKIMTILKGRLPVYHHDMYLKRCP